jgi:tetratricopeptide (TPR) repeat protein
MPMRKLVRRISLTGLLGACTFGAFGQTISDAQNCAEQYQIKEYDKALRYCDRALKKPDALTLDVLVETLFWQGMAHSNKADYPLAFQSFDQAIKENPDSAVGYIGRGLARASQKNMDQALVEMDRAVKADARSAAAYFQRGYVLNARGELDRALQDYNKAIDLNRKYMNAYDMRGRILMIKKAPNFAADSVMVQRLMLEEQKLPENELGR